MKQSRIILLACLIPVMTWSTGCITASALTVGVASQAIGDSVADDDLQERSPKLMGKGPEAADEMFGKRSDTLVDTQRNGREVLLYPVEGNLNKNARYVVEVADGKIVKVSRKARNKSGVTDKLKDRKLTKKLMGKGPEECQREAELAGPIAVLRSEETNDTLRLYNVEKKLKLGGASYCVLRFGANDKCKEIMLVGVSATTEKKETG